MNEEIIFTNKLISKGTKREKFKNDQRAKNLKRNVQVLKLKEMKEHGDKLYDEFCANEDYLISGYENKKLKSKKLIKQARKVINKRKEEAEKALDLDIKESE